MIHTTEYWLAEMDRIESMGIGPWARWATMNQSLTAAIREEQQTATHEALLASARDAVDRDLAGAGWRGVMAYVGTALRRLEDDTPLRTMAQAALLALETRSVCHLEKCPAAEMYTRCTLCQYAMWPDSPAMPQTAPTEHNPAPEGQALNRGEAKAFEIENLTEQLRAARKGVDYFYGRMREENARADKISARRDKARARAEQAEETLAGIQNVDRGMWQCSHCAGWFAGKVRPRHYDKGLLATIQLCGDCFDEQEGDDDHVADDGKMVEAE